MKAKLFLILAVFILAVGVVSATSIIDDNFKIPNGYTMEDVGDWYHNDKGFELGIQEYTFANDRHINMFTSHDGYEPVDMGNNIYTSKTEDTVYAFETVEFNGTTYYIESHCYQPKSDSDKDICYNNLIEFNKLNNLEPITPLLE